MQITIIKKTQTIGYKHITYNICTVFTKIRLTSITTDELRDYTLSEIAFTCRWISL